MYFYWKKTEVSENQISCSIKLILLQPRSFKVTPFFTEFTDYWDFGSISATRFNSIFTKQLAEVWEDRVHQDVVYHVHTWSGTPLIIQEIVTKQLFLAIFESPFQSLVFVTATSQISRLLHRLCFSPIPNTLSYRKMYSHIGIWAIVEELLSLKVIAILRYMTNQLVGNSTQGSGIQMKDTKKLWPRFSLWRIALHDF